MRPAAATVRAILIAGAGALAAGAALPALSFAIYWLAGRLFELHDVAFGLALILYALSGMLAVMAVGVTAGHLAARFDVQRPKVSAAMAASLASVLLAACWASSAASFLFGSLIAIATAAPISVIVAGHRASALALPATTPRGLFGG